MLSVAAALVANPTERDNLVKDRGRSTQRSVPRSKAAAVETN
jgi:hypothetical protein